VPALFATSNRRRPSRFTGNLGRLLALGMDRESTICSAQLAQYTSPMPNCRRNNPPQRSQYFNSN
jgi:hypothetical protein